MNDHIAQEQFVAYLDNELSLADRLALDAHIAGCSVCQKEIGVLRLIHGRTREAVQAKTAVIEAPVDAWAKFSERLALSEPTQDTPNGLRYERIPPLDTIEQYDEPAQRTSLFATLAPVAFAAALVAVFIYAIFVLPNRDRDVAGPPTPTMESTEAPVTDAPESAITLEPTEIPVTVEFMTGLWDVAEPKYFIQLNADGTYLLALERFHIENNESLLDEGDWTLEGNVITLTSNASSANCGAGEGGSSEIQVQHANRLRWVSLGESTCEWVAAGQTTAAILDRVLQDDGEAEPPVGTDITIDLPEGNAEDGAFQGRRWQCVECHITHPTAPNFGASETGPSVAVRAETLINEPGYTGSATTAEEYLIESILLPEAYIVPGWDVIADSPSDGPMPLDFGEKMTAQELADIIAWLWSFTEGVDVSRIGETQVRAADGMTMLYIPAGSFPMGRAAGFSSEKPVHDVSLDAFWIDITEVTNAQYASCVTAGSCQPSVYADDTDYNGGDYPAVGVSWSDAEAYCEWADAQLPTEAQWEYAARGPEGPEYPWGDEFSGENANFCDTNCLETSRREEREDDGYVFAAPVGNYRAGASWAGVLDMSGNVLEWVKDWYDDAYYASSPAANPQGPDSGETRVLRGGSWNNRLTELRAGTRLSANPDDTADDVGFRCVVPADG